jgi:hypothetical protein
MREETPNSLALEGPWSRLVGVVVSPRVTFESIVRKPNWLLPLLIFVFVNLAATYSQQRRGGLLTATQSAALEQQLKSNPAFSRLNPQQREQQLEEMRKLSRDAATGGAYLGVLLAPVALLITAAVFLAAFNIVFRADVKYAQSLAIASYSLVPFLLSSLMTLALIWIRPPGAVPSEGVSISLASFLHSDAPLWLASLAKSLDVFELWSLGLLAVGYTAVSFRRVRFRSALALVLSIFGIFLLVMTGLSIMVARR